jgi:putative ABC transport system substrate-binding protein
MMFHPSLPIKEISETRRLSHFKAHFGELRRLGYIEGQNLIIERCSGEGNTAHYAKLASELVRQQPDVVLTSSNHMVKNFKAATAAIPIVAFMGDPVADGLVDSLALPGGA